MPLSFDLLRLVKEVQLQHGLRSDDYARYHKYLSRRLQNVRKQLGISNSKKGFTKKKLAPQSVTDPRHLILLVLEAERAWGTSEETQQARPRESTAAVPRDQAPGKIRGRIRKRLNKATHWAQQLSELCEAAANERLKIEARGYFAEMKGRSAMSHGDLQSAKESFSEARSQYYSLHTLSDPTQWALVVGKVLECDDRVMYAMLRLGEDTSAYHPPLEAASVLDKATRVVWLDRTLNVLSVKVRDILRECSRLEASRVELMQQRDCTASGSAQARVLELYDRQVGLWNDAIAFSREDMRDSIGDRTEAQLLVHYLSFELYSAALQRTLFLIDVYAKRFRQTREALKKQSSPAERSGNSQKAATAGASKGAPGASPLAIVRLYDTAIERATDMSILPGVESHQRIGQDVNDALTLCKCGKLLYMAEGWIIVSNRPAALAAFHQIDQLWNELGDKSSPGAKKLKHGMQSSFTSMVAEPLVDSQLKTAEPNLCLADAPAHYVPCRSFMKFPPDFQSAPCKPVFVDIAGTYVEFASLSEAEAPKEKEKPKEVPSKPAKTGWFSWGWGRK